MRSWLRTYRKLLPPALCVALVTSQLLAAAPPGSQISHIKVNTTTTKFVRPVSQLSMAAIERMRHLANFLKPVSQLSEGSWLLDDSDAPELTIYQTEALIGDPAAAEGDAWTMLFLAITVVAAVATVVAITVMAAQTNTPGARIALQGAQLTIKAAVATAAALAAETARELLAAQQAAAAQAAALAEAKAEAKAAADAAKVDAPATANDVDNALAALATADEDVALAEVNAAVAQVEYELQGEETQSQLLAQIEAALGTDQNALLALQQETDDGIVYNNHRKGFYLKKKQMMLSLELDAHVLAAF